MKRDIEEKSCCQREAKLGLVEYEILGSYLLWVEECGLWSEKERREGKGVMGRPGHKPGWVHSLAGLTFHPIAPGVQITRSCWAISCRPTLFCCYQEL